MHELYAAFEGAKPAFLSAGVPAIEMLDRYRGQPLNPEQFEYYPLPAIFISRAATWARDAGQAYNAILSLDFHLVADATWDTNSLASNHVEALGYLKLIREVRRVLDNFSSERVSNLMRTGDREVDTGVVVYEVLSYECQYYEDQEEADNATGEVLETGFNAGLVRQLR